MSLDKDSKQNVKLKASTQGFYSEPPRAYIQSLYLKPLPRFSIWSCYFNSLSKKHIQNKFRTSVQNLYVGSLPGALVSMWNQCLESLFRILCLWPALRGSNLDPLSTSIQSLFGIPLCKYFLYMLQLESPPRVFIQSFYIKLYWSPSLKPLLRVASEPLFRTSIQGVCVEPMSLF